jgi:hypothetical protein
MTIYDDLQDRLAARRADFQSGRDSEAVFRARLKALGFYKSEIDAEVSWAKNGPRMAEATA